MGATELNIIKARSGRYKDTEENRRLHRVGQQYGEKKAPTTEVGSKDLSKYDTKTLQNTSKVMADKISEMRNTLSNMQGDERAMEAAQAKIDSATRGLAAVNSELAKRGVKATGNTAKEVGLPQEETKKEVEKQGRVHLGEAPNSSKVNLAKYLSAKAKANIDRILGQVIPTKSRAELITMYDDAVKNFNEGFDDMKKAARANMLYQILTIKAALDGKQGDKADIPLVSNMSKEEFADYIASPSGAARKAEMEAKMKQIRAEHEQKVNALEEEATKAYKTGGVDKVYVGDGTMDLYWEGDGSIAIHGPSRWKPDQDFTVRVSGLGSVYFNSEKAQIFNLAGEFLTNTKMKKQALGFLKKYQDILANTSKIQKETLTQYPDFSSDGTGVRIE